MTTTKERNTFFDGLKFVLIVLVVLGHVIAERRYNTANLILITFIWFFHMPLFVFISGYFTRKKKDTKAFRTSIFRLLETLICFQIPYLLPEIITKHYSISWLTVPRYLLWYLLSLIWWRIFIQYIPDKLLNKKTLMLCLSIAASILIVCITVPVRVLSYQRTFALLPFFLLGYYAKQTDIINKIMKLSPILTSCILIAICGVICFMPNETNNTLLTADHFANDNIELLSGNIGLNMLMRVFCLVIAAVMSVCFINLCQFVPAKSRNYGQNTMLFYIYHGLMLYFIRYTIARLNVFQSFPFISYMFIFVVIMILLFVMDRYRIFHLLINPISNSREITDIIRRKN